MTIAVALIALAAIPATLFPLIYSRSPWWRSSPGRAVMTLSVGLALLVDLSLVHLVALTWAGWPAVTVAVYALITVGLYWLLYALIRARRE